jgi:hypothetical protein
VKKNDMPSCGKVSDYKGHMQPHACKAAGMPASAGTEVDKRFTLLRPVLSYAWLLVLERDLEN